MFIVTSKTQRYKNELPSGKEICIDWGHPVANNLASLIIPARGIDLVNYADLNFSNAPTIQDSDSDVGFNLD